MVSADKVLTLEDIAYRIAKFKRDIDRIYNTGSVDNAFAVMCQHIPKEVDASIFNHLKERVEFYYNNRKIQPKDIGRSFKDTNLVILRYGEEEEPFFQLDDEFVIYGAEVFCGALIFVLPLPGCRALGGSLAADGGRRIFCHFMDKLCDQSKKNRENSAQDGMKELEDLD